jgi:hypothetical protein
MPALEKEVRQRVLLARNQAAIAVGESPPAMFPHFGILPSAELRDTADLMLIEGQIDALREQKGLNLEKLADQVIERVQRVQQREAANQEPERVEVPAMSIDVEQQIREMLEANRWIVCRPGAYDCTFAPAALIAQTEPAPPYWLASDYKGPSNKEERNTLLRDLGVSLSECAGLSDAELDRFWQNRLWRERQLAKAVHIAGTARSADNPADKKKKKHPHNPDVRDLCSELAARVGKDESEEQIALSFAHGNKEKAKSLLRQARRFPWLYRPE